MRIFATSDIHGNQAVIDKLERIAPSVDMVIICGDIGGKEGRTIRELGVRQRRDAARLLKKMKELGVPYRFILGNDDWFDCAAENYLNAAESISGYDLVPFEFVLITPFNTNREVNENKLFYELSKIKADERTIVVAHTPPYQCGDTLYNGSHVGSRSVHDWIVNVQPRIWLCGHIHEDHSVNKIGRTLIFNCACDHSYDELRGWIIDLDTLEYEKVRM